MIAPTMSLPSGAPYLGELTRFCDNAVLLLPWAMIPHLRQRGDIYWVRP